MPFAYPLQEKKFLPSDQLWSYHVSIHHIPDRMLENPAIRGENWQYRLE